MAKKDNPGTNNPGGACRHIRPNPITGELDYYFPLELTEENRESVELLARELGLEICRTRLGYRSFRAVLVPCRDKVMIRGVEPYVDTPSEVQHRRYLELIRDEMREQDRARNDGRCLIPDGCGGLKRCPRRVPNPDYTPGGEEKKTVAVRCEGCPFECRRPGRTVINMSCLDDENEDGEGEWFEAPAVKDLLSAEKYGQLRERFLDFVRRQYPRLVPLAELLTLEFTKSEAARELGDAHSTVVSRAELLKELLTAFLETVP